MLLRNISDKDQVLSKEFLYSEDAIFHYTRKDKVIEYILSGELPQLRFGEFSETNDPHEYRLKAPAVAGFVPKGSDRTPDEAFLWVPWIYQQSRFLAFCTNSYGDKGIIESGLLKPRMWAQYGENHRGVCLVLSRTELEKSLNRKENEHEAFLGSEVSYFDPDKQPIPILYLDAARIRNHKPYEAALQYILDNKEVLYFQKAEDFGDEREYRAVYLNKTQRPTEEVFVTIQDALRGIVVGDRFPYQYRPAIEHLVEPFELALQRVCWQKNGYELTSL
jgi:hypothetical protein